MSAIERSRSLLALDPRTRYLPDAAADGYVVGDTESLAEALHRLTTEQFTIAIDALSDPRADIGIATNATLHSIARIKAVLRLVRSSIGDESYRTELTILQETSDLLGGLLDGLAELRALDQLRARYQPVLKAETFSELRTQLHQRHQLRRLQALSEGEALQRALHRLRRARARFAAWPIDNRTDARMYGREPVADSFESVATGLERTYRRGRKHWRAVGEGKGSASPKWLRECRHLGHHLEVISSSWPAVLGATADSCHQLEAVLADDQAVSALHHALTSDGTLLVSDTERSLIMSLLATSRQELGWVASVIGARIYMEEPEQFLARMSAYWGARNTAPLTP